ncbi:unnamed protein product [Rhizophagus irregularis]|nr:unnamed protein product [Rhizophagus irregularis]CAB4434150.1 unnamed protein product [Rhizophagus irregularis]
MTEEPLSTHNTSEDVTQPVNIDGAERYILWLNLLGSQKFNEETVPIPPIDVYYIWHSHLLSPLRYYEDMRRIYDPQQNFPDFPLIRLHDIWEKTAAILILYLKAYGLKGQNNHGFLIQMIVLISK